MSLKKTWTLGALGAALLVTATAGQSQGEMGPGLRAGRQAVVKRFENAPKIGETLPDITLYDPDGKEVSLHEALTGHYTVLILGCLT